MPVACHQMLNHFTLYWTKVIASALMTPQEPKQQSITISSKTLNVILQVLEFGGLSTRADVTATAS